MSFRFDGFSSLCCETLGCVLFISVFKIIKQAVQQKDISSQWYKKTLWNVFKMTKIWSMNGLKWMNAIRIHTIASYFCQNYEVVAHRAFFSVFFFKGKNVSVMQICKTQSLTFPFQKIVQLRKMSGKNCGKNVCIIVIFLNGDSSYRLSGLRK